jgi:hypothetical protein
MSEQPTEIIRPEHQHRREAERLAALQNHPSFRLLIDRIENKRHRMLGLLVDKVQGGEALGLVQRQVDYNRGFIDGALYGKSVVDNAARELATGQETSEPEEELDGWPGFEG